MLMCRRRYLRLEALAARGPICKEGLYLDRFRVEVLGQELHIVYRERLRVSPYSGDLYPQREAHYWLQAREAERLLARLEREFAGETPAQALRREFEFTRPLNPLREYLDENDIEYEYAVDMTEPF